MEPQPPRLKHLFKLPPQSVNSRRQTLMMLSKSGTATLKASRQWFAIWQNTPVSVILRRGFPRSTAQAMHQSLCTLPLPEQTLIMKCPGQRFSVVLRSSSRKTDSTPKRNTTALMTLTRLPFVRPLPSVAL